MVSVLGPFENLEKYVMSVVENSDIDGLEVVVNDDCSIKDFLEKNKWDIPYVVRSHMYPGYPQKEIAVYGDTIEEYSKLFGLIKGTREVRKAVISYVYPYHPECVIVVDKNYRGLGRDIREVIQKVSDRAIHIF
jgi:hypothetical protein